MENWRRCLKILDIFDIFCRENGLSFQMAYGSCLGAIRHHGFIPWDRNLDTTMSLEDYETLKKLCDEGGLPDSLAIADSSNGGDEGRQVLRIVLNEDEDMGKYLYPNLDVSIYCGLSNHKFVRKAEMKESYLNHKIYRLKNINSIKRKFPWSVLKAMLALVPNKLLQARFHRILKRHPLSEAEYVTSIETVYGKEVFRKEWVETSAQVDFEGRKVNVPVDYDKYLTALYGDYMKPVVFDK